MIDGLITLDCEQGSDEWHKARLGIPTATGIDSIVSASGKRSAGFIGYLAELIAESIEGSALRDFKSRSMERGNELEPKARAAYEFMTDNKVTQVGGVYKDENREIMISPDGLIPELKKGLEIKCPELKTHIRYVLEGVLPTEYVVQVQSSLWVTGYESWDFVSYCPEYHKQSLYILTIKPNPKMMKAFDTHIPAFLKALKSYK